LRIALWAPVALPVPPSGYGGTELVISLLADGLVERGHHVTLYASGDSQTKAHRRTVHPCALTRLGLVDKAGYSRHETAHILFALSQAHEFDIIHDHTKTTGTLASRFCPTPCVTTIHNDFTPERRQVYGSFRDHAYVAISRAHAERMPELGFRAVVYNGLDMSKSIYRETKEDYLLFLGRLDADKGAHTAARLAEALDLPLIMAGRLAPADRPFFEAQVAPHLDGIKRRYIGEVTGTPKGELYAGARALLFPIQWAEPFGLVMIEAMAAGTPVVATNYGSVQEVVADGVTGAIAASEADFEGLKMAVGRALTLRPTDCRARVATHFSKEKMVDDYLAVYDALLAKQS
jgi:glycosyltransferase involved in cell wall biosynthesis